MFRGRGPAGRGRGGAPRPSKASTTGLFAEGIWQCNCQPRLPAEHFRVRKEGKNQGRWFYTCQKGQDQRCDFFLWDEDAKPREEAAVLSNSRNEPRSSGPVPVTPSRPRQQEQHISPPPPYTPVASNPPSGAGIKRRAEEDIETEDEEEFYPWPLTGQEEQQILGQTSVSGLATPRKAPRTGEYATPGRYAISSTGLPTPMTERTSRTLPVTPSPARARDVPGFADITPMRALADSPAPEKSLVTEVFELLRQRNANFNQDTADALRSLLDRHVLRDVGLVKGRDISRLALKARDAKITELQARIASLEAEREIDRAVMAHMREDRRKGG